MKIIRSTFVKSNEVRLYRNVPPNFVAMPGVYKESIFESSEVFLKIVLFVILFLAGLFMVLKTMGLSHPTVRRGHSYTRWTIIDLV